MNLLLFLFGLALEVFGFGWMDYSRMHHHEEYYSLIVVAVGLIVLIKSVNRSKRLARRDRNINQAARNFFQAYVEDVAQHSPDDPQRRFGRREHR